MTLAELIDHTRRQYLADTVAPYEWSDGALTRWFNEAQEVFAHDTQCFVDAEADFTWLTTVAGVGGYAIDPRIHHVLSVTLPDGRALSSARFVGPAVHEGAPRSFAIKPGPQALQLYPLPDAEYTLSLVVVRAPLASLALPDDEPEIPPHYHLLLCDWVAYQALRTTESDNSDMEHAQQVFGHWARELIRAKESLFVTTTAAPHIVVPRVV